MAVGLTFEFVGFWKPVVDNSSMLCLTWRNGPCVAWGGNQYLTVSWVRGCVGTSMYGGKYASTRTVR